LATPAHSRTGTIRDVEHIVVFMQENRSFDHYFGHLRGVRGYNDRFPIPMGNGLPVWLQPSRADAGRPVAPFHLDTQTTSAQCIGDLNHTWHPTHAAINNGRMDRWPKHKTDMTMGYHLRGDIPFHYALADAFTVCDAYFCSLAGPTHPNRAYLMSGMIDPGGTMGGPLLDNHDYVDGDRPPKYQNLSWTTYPERLQAGGVSWQVYQQGTGVHTPRGSPFGTNNFGTNILQNFTNFIDAAPGSPLYRRAQAARTIADLKNDVLRGRLPQVSWLVPPAEFSEHPRYMPAYGAQYTAQVIDALTANAEVWSKTVLFIMYDENDGFFDHVPPPQAPAHERQGASTVTVEGEIHSVVNPDGRHGNGRHGNGRHGSGRHGNGRHGKFKADHLPFGLGPRVPMTIVSPWTKGGFVCSQVFDHTSVIRFIEARFGIAEPNITPWRRAVCGDLTSAFDFGAADAGMPALPDTNRRVEAANLQCASQPRPVVPAAPGPIEPQEVGVRPARALPYELQVHGRVDTGANALNLIFENTGRQGAHFYVYGTNRTDGPWRYTVEAGKRLAASFDLAATGGAYAFEVHGPNGFLRKFSGQAAPDLRSGRQGQAEVRADYDAAHGTLRLVFTHTHGATARLRVSDGAYGAPERVVKVAPSGTVIEAWNLAPSHNWYDLIVANEADGRFSRRIAGHMEDGRPSISDPAAVAPVTAFERNA
jgi:phospholipase C